MISKDLQELFSGFDAKHINTDDVKINGVCCYSKEVEKGDLFIAKRHPQIKTFIKEALAKGAIACLLEEDIADLDIPAKVICPDIDNISPLLAKKAYDDPSSKLLLIGVTGTNGKTTTSFMIKELLEHHYAKEVGLLGTIQYQLGNGQVIQARLTTPDTFSINKYLHEMVCNKVPAAVMEASSHALFQNRLKGLDFDVGVFTNLSQDHLDYHKSMEEYKQAKGLLFSMMGKDTISILNEDDQNYPFFKEKSKGKCIGYSAKKSAEVFAKDIKATQTGVEFTLKVGEEVLHKVESPFSGIFNVENTLAAIGVAVYGCGADKQKMALKLKELGQVPGRLQRIENRLGIDVFVDFAHTSDALDSVLQNLRSKNKSKLITVIGCGGDRDRKKRPLMGDVALHRSDYVIFTSDNPRSEDPEKIIDEMVSKENVKNVHFEKISHRRSAIERALKIAKCGDVVIIAGRGHEQYQEIKGKKIPFCDAQVIKQLLL